MLMMLPMRRYVDVCHNTPVRRIYAIVMSSLRHYYDVTTTYIRHGGIAVITRLFFATRRMPARCSQTVVNIKSEY